MASRREKVNAGLFLMTGLLLLFATLAVIAGVQLDKEVTWYEVCFTDSVRGLAPGSNVVYLGVRVGSVASVEAEVGSVTARIEVSAGTPIKTGTYAVLDTNLLTGVSAIELRGGAQDELDLAEGQTIRWEHSTLGAVGESLPAAVGGVEEVLARLSALLDTENRERIARLLDSADLLAVTSEREVVLVGDEVAALRRDLSSTAQEIDLELKALRSGLDDKLERGVTTVEVVGADLSATLSSFEQLAKSVEELTEHVDTLAGELQGTVARLDTVLDRSDRMLAENRDDVAGTLTQLRHSARSLRELLELMERDPWVVLRGASRGDARRPGGER